LAQFLGLWPVPPCHPEPEWLPDEGLFMDVAPPPDGEPDMEPPPVMLEKEGPPILVKDDPPVPE